MGEFERRIREEEECMSLPHQGWQWVIEKNKLAIIIAEAKKEWPILREIEKRFIGTREEVEGETYLAIWMTLAAERDNWRKKWLGAIKQKEKQE